MNPHHATPSALPPPVRVPIPGGRALLVVPTRPGARLDAPLCAVNLLRQRRRWSYTLYSLLAYPAVLRAKGRILLKARLDRTLAGPPFLQDTLLIVGYPDAASFLRMVTRLYFVLISGLRQLGLADFRFGFCEARGDAPPGGPWNHPQRLLAVLSPFDAELPGGVDALAEAARARGANLLFAGWQAGFLAATKGQRPPRPTRGAPRLEAGWVLVFAAPTDAPLDDLAANLEPALRDGASLVLLRREM
jgi:hypothetical protein